MEVIQQRWDGSLRKWVLRFKDANGEINEAVSKSLAGAYRVAARIWCNYD